MSDYISAAGLIQVSYLVTAFLFIMGLKRMSSPVTARSGILWAGAGMLVATLATFFYPGISGRIPPHQTGRSSIPKKLDSPGQT